MAQEKLATDPEGAQELITGAHSEAKKAIAELRDLSRGIYPAILTDRGLGPALSSIAARNPVEVALDVDLDGAAAGRHRGGRLLRHGRGAHERRQALGRRARARADRAARRTCCGWRSPTTATAAPTPTARA